MHGVAMLRMMPGGWRTSLQCVGDGESCELRFAFAKLPRTFPRQSEIPICGVLLGAQMQFFLL
jgi:hypothetical protein